MSLDTINEFNEFLDSGDELKLSSEEWAAIDGAYNYLHEHIKAAKEPVYGVNTGFGSLCDVEIEAEELGKLQENLLITHAAGVGPMLSKELSKAMLLLKIKNISKGYSGVSRNVAQRLIDFYNLDIIPAIHSQGSLGASGDLAPLSELFLPLIGLGYFWKDGEPAKALPELSRRSLQPLILQAKEALGLINGTQFMLAHAMQASDLIGDILMQLPKLTAASLNAVNARHEPFLPQIHAIRPHQGQNMVASEILDLLEQAESREKTHIQDPYSFRCVPQVHGASLDALQHCLHTWDTELKSVTDNPNVFAEDKLIISGGNFHGQPLALTLDYAAMAIAELASISERRTYYLMGGFRNLPAYLSPKPGMDSGYMIAQYTAASLVSQNKQLCSPASIDSIMSSNGQEDHVSMGANAATKLIKVIENAKQVFAIEWLVSAQALNFVEASPGSTISSMQKKFKLKVDAHQTVSMTALIEKAYHFLWN
ncbi:MAG: aromatic amino acid ammonia-lyase [Bacteroidia bacterium]|nr:aromatic amino acid ammonia-lyase [Bacteroidia bacterium]